ncbi:histidine kinase [Frankia sp. Mgl5]|nr:histidine kinase [Frankia sp. Mgl5]
MRAFIPSARLSSPAPDEFAAGPAAEVPVPRVAAESPPAAADGARTAWSPAPPARTPPDLVVVPVTSLGEVVGDVAVQPWPDRPLSGADRRLLADLAAQAGPALRGVALAAELSGRLDQITRQSTALRASRERIATAQVEERRRLERDIHDGAQQHLLAAVLSLRTAEGLVTTATRAATGAATTEAAEPEPEAAEEDAAAALRRCRDDLDRCIDDLRELARGIYPPVLAARGLVAAIRARARTAPGTVRVTGTESLNGHRLPRQTEAAAYFACLEAMQNATKHAPGAAVSVEIGLADGVLSFTVSDDGPGFDPTAPQGGGTGLLGMADRVGAAGGALSIRSAPGNGTTVSGTLPVSPDVSGQQDDGAPFARHLGA